MCECVRVCVSADMSPYCSAHDEWLIMKLCMYVGSHDANNVSNFSGEPVTQLNFKKRFIYAVLRTWRSMSMTLSVSAAVGTRSGADCSSMEGHTSLSTALVMTTFCRIVTNHNNYIYNRRYLYLLNKGMFL